MLRVLLCCFARRRVADRAAAHPALLHTATQRCQTQAGDRKSSNREQQQHQWALLKPHAVEATAQTNRHADSSTDRSPASTAGVAGYVLLLLLMNLKDHHSRCCARQERGDKAIGLLPLCPPKQQTAACADSWQLLRVVTGVDGVWNAEAGVDGAVDLALLLLSVLISCDGVAVAVALSPSCCCCCC